MISFKTITKYYIMISVQENTYNNNKTNEIKNFKMKEWISKDKINWVLLCKNKNAMNFIEENIKYIKNNFKCWSELSIQPYALPILEKYHDKINWNFLSHNPNALHLLEENPDKIDSSHICLNTNMNVCKILMDENIILFKMWNYIYSNSGCMELIKKQDINDINWIYLCKNENPEALDIVRRHVILLNQECFLNLCKNINGVVVLEDIIDHYLNEIYDKNVKLKYFKYLALNPNGIHLLEKYIDDFSTFKYFYCIVQNENALHIIKEHLQKLDEIIFDEDIKFKIEGIKSSENLDYHPFGDKYFKDDRENFHNSKNEDDELYEIEKKYKNLKYNLTWNYLCLNKNPDAIEIIENNLDKLNSDCWDVLSKNKHAIHILEQNQSKVNWDNLMVNEAIFDLI